VDRGRLRRRGRARGAARGTLFTYSASTAVRVAMLLGGWAVGVGDGIGSKRQTTAAAVAPPIWARPAALVVQRLAQPEAPLPADAPPDVLDRVARLAAVLRGA
jgi:hypothetical protein